MRPADRAAAAAGLALLLAGCAGAPRPAAAAPKPGESQLRYAFELEAGPPPRVRVRVSARGTDAGATTLVSDETWASASGLGEHLRDFAARGRDGRALAIEAGPGTRWTVRHEPGEAIEVVYEIRGIAEVGPENASYYRPILLPKLFHLIGGTGLVYPQHLAGGEARTIEVRWVGFREAGWNVVSSFGLAPEGFRVSMPVEDFRHALFAAGDWRLFEVDAPDGKLAVAIFGTDWGFTDDAFVRLARRIVHAERSFFREENAPLLLISLIPVGTRSPGSRSLGGTGLSNSFALFMLPGTTLESSDEKGLGVAGLLAHELFHRWTGEQIRLEEPERLVYWFSEGFTNFYARRLLHRAGILSTDGYARELNEALVAYYTSPVKDAPNARIGEDFWNDRAVERLPYARGDVVALLLDHEIRRASAGAQTLDDFMRAVHVGSVRRGEGANTDRLLEIAARFSSPEAAARLRAVVVDGAVAEIPKDALEPCLEMTTESIGPWEPGFDLEATRRDRTVTGVVEGSAAWREGLRDGQRIGGWSVAVGDPRRPIELTLVEASGTWRISFLPQGQAVPVPAFRVRSGASGCRDWL